MGVMMMKRAALMFAVIMIYLFSATPSHSLPYLVIEPALETQTVWNMLPNGMLFVGYDRDNTGKPDFFTLRVVERSYFSKDPARWVAGNCPDNIVFFVDYDTERFFYIAAKLPLFYAIDVNEDGSWDLMYKDVSEDGVNGNEKFYESPSGMFTANIARF